MNDVTPAANGTPSGPGIAPDRHQRLFVLQRVQPALLGLMDGAVSALAPICATAGLTGDPLKTFWVGTAASLGAGISMGLAEALSDDGTVTGRGMPFGRGGITGVATVLGGMLHTLPFLLLHLGLALYVAYAAAIAELLAISYIRHHYMRTPLAKTLVQVVIGGGVVFAVGMVLGNVWALLDRRVFRYRDIRQFLTGRHCARARCNCATSPPRINAFCRPRLSVHQALP